MHPATDMPSAMSPFAGLTSDVGSAAEVVRTLCWRVKLIQSHQSWARRDFR
jgi:hypothetical protein